MIEKISANSVNTSKKPSMNEPRFTGLTDGLLSIVQTCERNPMVNVAVLDLSTAIIPRTVVESETNPYAGFEAFRREASGLIINCMIPSLVVLGIAKLIERPMMGGKTKMGSCWANEETINLVKKYWEDDDVKNLKTDKRVRVTIENFINDFNGADESGLKSFRELIKDKKAFTKLANTVIKPTKYSNKQIKQAFKLIAEQTHITENIKVGDMKDYTSQNLKAITKALPEILKAFIDGKDATVVAKKASHLVNAKSLAGLGVILPLAIAAQPINRWITAKRSGKKGAPIYKDFAQSKSEELTSQEKKALAKQKLISVGSMIGVALLSMMKIPNMAMLKEVTQFKGIFPTMDQARVISTATFASRMMASEDKNDLREATVRDIATFSSFYFLGDYVAKGIATFIQKHSKKGIKLINVLETPDKNANALKRFWHWAKHTALKSSDEVIGKEAQKMRAICQLGNIAFSLISLGIIIPKIYRGQTDKKRQEQLKKMGIDPTKFYPHFAKNSINFASKSNTYKDFFTSK